MKYVNAALLAACLFLVLTGCVREEIEIDPEVPEVPVEPVLPEETETQKVNRFIAEDVEAAYLWTSTIDWHTIDPLKEPDSYALFDKLKYKDDRWSLLTSDLGQLQNQVDGVSTTFGYQLIFGLWEEPDELFGIVLYVYPGTPAEEAGLKRGDLLLEFNGGAITEANWNELYDAPSIQLTRGTWQEPGFVMLDSEPVSMTARMMYQDPVIKDTVIEVEGNRIGYLCYVDYTVESEVRLQEVFSRFELEGVTDVVLDLRYNGGGYARTSVLLSSILAPAGAVKNREVFLTQVWNDTYMAELKKEEVTEYFTDTLPVNMNLSRLYVLVSRNTASASESTIVGLKPYMDVVLIGDTTHGKYCGGALLSPQVWDSSSHSWTVNKEIPNWGMYLMLYRFANKEGISSFTGGLAPAVRADEDYFPLYPWGDPRDLLLGKAVERITGKPYLESRSGKQLPPRYAMRTVELRSPLAGKRIDTPPRGRH